MLSLQKPLGLLIKSRVELHIHLDGSIRHETIWEMFRKKQMKLPGDGSLEALKNRLVSKEEGNLETFLEPFGFFFDAFVGDLDAVERISYEFVEDQSKRNVAYCEARLCPHLFVPDSKPSKTSSNDECLKENGKTGDITIITPQAVLEACLRGIKRGEEKHGTKARLILCCIRGKSEWSLDILNLCEIFRNEGVVGIDIVGSIGGSSADEFQNVEEIKLLECAKEKGIHRTIHAGETSGWKSVQEAISRLGAERIGHGYSVVENEEFYQKCLAEEVHFEMCPTSSYMTGAIRRLSISPKRHPILRLAEDGASFSINSDDPTLTGTCVSDEYELLRKWGFTEANIARANFEAAKRCFLPHDEKEELLSNLREAYGVVVSPLPLSISTSDPDPAEQQQLVAPKPAITIASWEDRTD